MKPSIGSFQKIMENAESQFFFNKTSFCEHRFYEKNLLHKLITYLSCMYIFIHRQKQDFSIEKIKPVFGTIWLFMDMSVSDKMEKFEPLGNH